VSATGATDIIVVDTNVVSFCFKGDTRAVLYRPHLEARLQIIAAQTRAELELWTLIRNWGSHQRSALHSFHRDFLLAEADEEICLRWAEVQASARKQGNPLSISDAWIAATALALVAPLITHNPRDFANIPGLTVLTEN